MKIQRLMFKENLRAAGLVTLLGLASCAIDNDIPYPLVEGTISEIVTEGLRASEDGTVASGVDIDRSARTVTLYVNDSVDVSRLRLTRLILDPRDATIELDSARCDDKEKFPFHDFASLDSLSLSANTRLDLSTPLELNVRTYQDNPWTLTVRQIVDRTVDVDGMVDHLVDPVSRVAVIYVSADQDLSNIKVRTLNLGGAYGRVTPDPTTVRDFTYPQNMTIQLPQTSVIGPYGVSNSRFIEFIVNMDTGRFVSEWNVYKKRKDGSIDSNPKHYKIEDGADIADTDSANYGLSKGLNADLPAYLNNSHTYLDVRHPADNAIRRKMVRKWKNPKNVLNGGRYADIVKKGGLKDLETWRQVKAEDRLQVYNAYLDYIRSHLVLNGFDSFYQETYKPQGGDKKD